MLRTRRLTLALGAVAVAGLLLAACGGGGGSSSGGGGGGQGEVVVTASEFSFEPKEIKAKVGQPVTIVLKNAGAQQHDLTIDGIQVTVDGQDKTGVQTELVGAGGETRVTFTPKQAGSYEFYCSVPGHKAAGMTGTLVVEQ